MEDKYKLVICVSAGLDSLGAVYYAKDVYCPKENLNFSEDVCLLHIIDKDSPYAEKELNIVNDLYGAIGCNLEKITLSGYGTWAKTDDHVILGRNAVYASIAAAKSPLIWMMGTKFEDNNEMYDKNIEFWYLMSKALTQASWYKRTEMTIVESPFQDEILWDKVEIITFLEENGYTNWRETTSCFHPSARRCGSCTVCGKRFIYEKYVELKSGITFSKNKELRETYGSDPLKNVHLLKTYESMKVADSKKQYNRYKKERIDIYKTVLKHYQIE